MTIRLLLPFAFLGIAFSQTPAGPPNQPPRQPQPRPAAQPGPPAPMDGDLSGLKTFLNLTEPQVQQLRQAGERARRDAEEKARTNQPLIRDKHMALEDLLSKGSNDAAAVGRLMIDIRALERQVREAHEAIRSSQLNVLTPEQRARFRVIEEEASRPEAVREARRLGLVQMPPQNQPDPRPAMQPNRPGQPNQPGQPNRPMQPMRPNPPRPPDPPFGREGGAPQDR